jgi:outer membrane receptor protein involved in Fe transport
VWGGEVELNYQPNRNFYLTLSYSYLDPILHNQSPSQKTSNVFDTFLPPVGNGSGSPNSARLSQADYLQPGIPHHLFNANVNYQFDFGLGFSFGAEVTSPINVTYGGTVKIPTQFTLNAGIFYRWRNCEVRVDFLNFTNAFSKRCTTMSGVRDFALLAAWATMGERFKHVQKRCHKSHYDASILLDINEG